MLMKFKKTKKILKIILFIVLFLFILFNLFPAILFSNSFTFDNFTFYSNQAIDDEDVKSIINEANALISKSTILNKSNHYKIFLCNKTFYYPLFATIHYQSFAVTQLHNVIVSSADLKKNQALSQRNDNYVRILSSVIAHEIMHINLSQSFGFLKHKFYYPNWKIEGYCDYIANESSFDFKKGVELMKKGDVDNSISFRYFKYRQIIRYLIEEKKMTVTDIMGQTLSFKEIEEETKINL